jgi:hypothetical protein
MLACSPPGTEGRADFDVRIKTCTSSAPSFAGRKAGRKRFDADVAIHETQKALVKDGQNRTNRGIVA